MWAFKPSLAWVVACLFVAAALGQESQSSGPQALFDEDVLSRPDLGDPPITSGDESSLFQAERHPRYRLNINDVVSLAFPFAPEFDQTVTIQPDGFVTLSTAGDIYAAGKSVPEFVADVRKAYSTILKEPIVNLELVEFQRPYFVVGGHVMKPGRYDLDNTTTVTEAIAVAGGLTNASKHSQVLLFRVQSEKWMRVIQVNMKEMIQQGDLSEDPFLRPGDMVYVPKNFLSKIRDFIPRASVRPW